MTVPRINEAERLGLGGIKARGPGGWRVHTSGLVDWISDLRGAHSFLIAGLEDEFDQIGARVTRTARGTVKVDTGRLKRSIGHRVFNEQGLVTLEVGPGLGDPGAGFPPYAPIIERRDPFMLPAVKKHTGPRSKGMRAVALIAERAFAG